MVVRFGVVHVCVGFVARDGVRNREDGRILHQEQVGIPRKRAGRARTRQEVLRSAVFEMHQHAIRIVSGVASAGYGSYRPSLADIGNRGGNSHLVLGLQRDSGAGDDKKRVDRTTDHQSSDWLLSLSSAVNIGSFTIRGIRKRKYHWNSA